MFICNCCRQERGGVPIYNKVCETYYCDECNFKLIQRMKEGLTDDIMIMLIRMDDEWNMKHDIRLMKRELVNKTVDYLVDLKKEIKERGKSKKN